MSPLGKGKKTILVYLEKDITDELDKRADSMQISTSQYCQVILSNWIESDNRLSIRET